MNLTLPALTPTVPTLPVPTRAERWVSDGGRLVYLLLPSTDRGVARQAVAVGVVFLTTAATWRADLVQLWAGSLIFRASLFVLRSLH